MTSLIVLTESAAISGSTTQGPYVLLRTVGTTPIRVLNDRGGVALGNSHLGSSTSGEDFGPFPPMVIGLAAPGFHGPGVKLVEPLSPGWLDRHASHYRLQPPAVVAPVLARPVKTKLAPSPRQARAPHSKLRPRPSILATPFVAAPIKTKLAPSSRLARKALSGLGHPQVLNGNTAVPEGPMVLYVQPPRQARSTRSRLAAPAVVPVVTQAFAGPKVELARSRRGAPKSRLLPVPAAFQPVGTLDVHLAYSRRGAPKSRLTLTRVIDLSPQTYYLATTFARIRPPRTLALLRRPTDTVGLEDQGRVATHLAYSRRGAPRSRLAPPAVVLAPQVFFGPKVAFAVASKRGIAKSKLKAPTLIDLTPQVFSIATTFVRISPPRTHPHLSPPADVTSIKDIGYLRAHLAYSRRGTPKSILRDPVVIDLTPQTYYLSTTFARIVPPRTHFRLGPPTDLIDAADLGYVRIHLAPSKRGTPKSRLSLTAIIDLRPQVYSLAVTLAPSRRGIPKSKLRQPTDLIDAQDLGFLRTHLAYSRRGIPKSRLRPPTVVSPILAQPIATTLAYSRRGKPLSGLGRPVALFANTAFPEGPMVSLAPSSRGRAKSRLAAPSSTTPYVPPPYPVSVTLAYSLRGRPKSRLAPPVVVAPVLARPAIVSLAPSSRGIPKSKLRPPAVVAPVLARPTLVHLAYSRRGKPRSFLRPMGGPAVVYGAIATTLAYSLRGKPKSHLSPPVPPETFAPVHEEIAVQLTRVVRERKTIYRLGPPIVVLLAVELSGPETTLVRIRPVPTRSFLRPPTDLVDQNDVGELRTHLAYSRRGTPKSTLRPPTVVFTAVELSGPETTLVRIRPPATRSHLGPMGPPAVAYRAILTHLAYSRRGAPKSKLSAPSAFAPQPAPIYPVSVTLAYQSRGKPKSILRKPVVIDIRPQVYTVTTTLAPSRRVRTNSFLRPTVYARAAFVARPLDITLAPQRRGTAKSRLRTVVYAARSYAPLKVTLAPSSRLARRTHSRLPVVVYAARSFAPIAVTQAPRPKPRTMSRLAPPAIVAQVVIHEPTHGLVRIRPPRVHSKLSPPAVVGAGITFRGLLVHLTYSRRGEPKSLLSFTEREVHECYGDPMCGFDFAAEVCGTDDAATVAGSTSTGTSATGTDAGANVDGASAASGSVTGDDARREGC